MFSDNELVDTEFDFPDDDVFFSASKSVPGDGVPPPLGGVPTGGVPTGGVPTGGVPTGGVPTGTGPSSGTALICSQLSSLKSVMEVMVKSNQDVLTELKAVATRVQVHEQRLDASDARFESVETRVVALESKIQEMTQKVTLTEQTQHDVYSAAFSRSDEFFRVFSFMVLYAYDTTSGLTCAVFRRVNETPCVCINLRALHNIAKMWLNSARITRSMMFPSFKLFSVTNLQRLFREANLPQCKLDIKAVNDCYKHVSAWPLHTVPSMLSNWIGLEMNSFVTGIKLLARSEKFTEFRNMFLDHFPKSESNENEYMRQKQITEKDKVFVWGGTLPKQTHVPVFGVPYWDCLFTQNMLLYRNKLHPKAQITEHQHFANFLMTVDEPIFTREEVFQKQQELDDARAAEEEEKEREKEEARVLRERESQQKKRSRRRKPQQHQEEEEEQQQEEEEEEAAGEERPHHRKHKRPRHH
jgi:hypothetical protein